MKRDFLCIWDLPAEEISMILERASDLKSGKDKSACPLIGRSVGLLFEKASTRTRVSFEAGIYQLGGQAVYMNASELQLGRGETIPDTARALSRYLSAIVIRTHSHSRLEDFAGSSSIPVVNGLSALHHPCQILADLMTILEKKGRLKGVRLAYIGDGNNVANSLIEAASRMEINLVMACPEGYEPSPEILERARGKAKSEIVVLRDPKEAAAMADAVYTDVWVSMGHEAEAEARKKRLMPYQLNEKVLGCAKKDAIVMHCLPAHRGEEITDDVMDGHRSAIFDQAENRLHAQKALLEFLLK